MSKNNSDTAEYAKLAPVHALHYLPDKKPSITALEIANSILFLASDQAPSINGVSLPVDKAWGVI